MCRSLFNNTLEKYCMYNRLCEKDLAAECILSPIGWCMNEMLPLPHLRIRRLQLQTLKSLRPHCSRSWLKDCHFVTGKNISLWGVTRWDTRASTGAHCRKVAPGGSEAGTRVPSCHAGSCIQRLALCFLTRFLLLSNARDLFDIPYSWKWGGGSSHIHYRILKTHPRGGCCCCRCFWQVWATSAKVADKGLINKCEAVWRLVSQTKRRCVVRRDPCIH